MRLALTLLWAWCWAIYCNHNRALVLSLPPSLIDEAAALRQQHAQRAALFAAKNSPLLHSNSYAEQMLLLDQPPGTAAKNKPASQNQLDAISNNGRQRGYKLKKKRNLESARIKTLLQQQPNRKLSAYDLNALLGSLTDSDSDIVAAAAANAELENYSDNGDEEENIEPGGIADGLAESAIAALLHTNRAASSAGTPETAQFFSPLKYWSRNCHSSDNNCPEEHYQSMLAGNSFDKNFTPAKLLRHEALAEEVLPRHAAGSAKGHDVFMYLTGEHDIIKFLNWALTQLYPNQKFHNLSVNDADYYHPDEPRYVIVRKDKWPGRLNTDSYHNDNDPFIPPRGRKNNQADLEALLQHRFETFVPNRGRRDNIKDMLQHDDLFFPNRGKKHKASNGQELWSSFYQAAPKFVSANFMQDNKLHDGYNVYDNVDDDDANNNHAVDDDESVDEQQLVASSKTKLFEPPQSSRAEALNDSRLTVQQECKFALKNCQQQQQVDGNKNRLAISSKNYHNNNKNNSSRQAWPDHAALNLLPPQLSAWNKLLGSDQSAAMTSVIAATKASQQQQANAAASKPAQQWHSTYYAARSTRWPGISAAAARLAGNRMHSTRSMLSRPHQQQSQQQQQYRRKLSNTSSSSSSLGLKSLLPQQSTRSWKHHSWQSYPLEPPPYATSSSAAAAATYLQQQLQRQAVDAQHLGRQQPPETQLARFVANYDDTDYAY